jgi:hypothetical protein
MNGRAGGIIALLVGVVILFAVLWFVVNIVTAGLDMRCTVNLNSQILSSGCHKVKSSHTGLKINFWW